MIRLTRSRIAFLVALPAVVLLLPTVEWRLYVSVCHDILHGVVTYADGSCRGGAGAPRVDTVPWVVIPSWPFVLVAAGVAMLLASTYVLRDRRRQGQAAQAI